MFMPKEDHHGLVRGVVGAGFHGCGCISCDREDMEKRGGVVAYTPWHRHDENPEAVAFELERLSKLYTSMRGSCGAILGYEYKPYKN